MERRLESLEGEWQVRRIDKRSGQPAGNPFPGKVPGDVMSDLARNGMIEDPYLDRNDEKCLWVNDCDWLYRRRISGQCPPTERRFLRFSGVDYEAWFRLNGQLLGAHEGMFGRVIFEVTSRLEAENEIEVLLVGRKNTRLERINAIPLMFRNEKSRMKTLKAQYSYGWDFAPQIKGAGIWDDVYLHSTGPVAVEDIWIKPDAAAGAVTADVFLSSRASGEGRVEWRIELVGRDGVVAEGVEELEYVAGPQRVLLNAEIADPLLWDTWDLGERNIYRLSVEVFFGEESSDAITDTFGFRTIGFEPNPNAPADSLPWTVVINGRRLFLRGVNWVPMDSLLGRLDDEKYRKLLIMAKEMGANMIRVWGGGLREKRVFYEICDELGLLVWQEFPFACAFLGKYPRTGKYLKLVARECAEIVRQLRNHPSIFMWCGGNELRYARNGAVIDVVKQQVETHDGTRRFHATSPSKGDSHSWVVWHGKGNLRDYLDDHAPMISEFGLQSLPGGTTVEAMLSEKFRWPPDKKMWEHRCLQWDKTLKYAERYITDDSLEGFIKATQKVQAHFLKTAVERWRRMKFAKAGFGLWQFNDAWPSCSWSVVDYFLRPKLAYHALKMSMAPLAVALFYRQDEWRRGDRIHYDVVVMNDYHRAFHELTARVFIRDREVDSARLDVKPNSVVAAEDRRVKLDCDQPWILRVVLTDSSGNELARNEHDLAIYDPDRAPLITRWLFNAARRLMSDEKQTLI